MLTRDQMHQFIDLLPDTRLAEVSELLEKLADPVLWALATAPEDDEPLTEEDIAALDEGRAALARGEVIPDEEVWRRLGHESTG